MLELICQTAQSLQQFTDENYAQASFYFDRLLKDKEIKVNGKKVGQNVPLKQGDIVRFYLTPKQQEKPAFFIRYEDENILIIDKESGVNAEAVCAELCRSRGEVGFIHRLDRNTRGLMVFSLCADAEQQLLSAFKEKRVEKIYHARCFNAPPKQQDIVTAYLRKEENISLVRIYDTPVKDSEKICTQYRVIAQEDNQTLVEIILHTGKTHQIRAHMAHLGCPVVGDMKYGDTEKNRRLNTTRQQLIAKRLQFTLEGRLSYLNEKTFFSQYTL